MPTELERSAKALGLSIERFALALAAEVSRRADAQPQVAATALPSLLTVDELAAIAGVPRTTIYGWRVRGYGPPAARFGKYLRYRRDDVEVWLAEHVKEGS